MSRLGVVLPVLTLVLSGGVACATADGAPETARSAVSAQRAEAVADSVVAISIDGLNPQALRRLGRSGTPNLHKLIRQGASTLNARTEQELTLTLPNHTGMVTGRRIEAATGGHGVNWNDDRQVPATVQAAAGGPVDSVFTVVDQAGLSAGFFASKTKFALWDRSWPDATDTQTIIEDNDALVRTFTADLTTPRAFRLLHLSETDTVGHAKGFMGKAYLQAVRRADRRVGVVIKAIKSDPVLAARTSVIVTADHGGQGFAGGGHGNPTKPSSFTVPFVAWGAGVERGADLYQLNADDYLDPGRQRTTYSGLQPVRNGDVANLSLDLLGLGPVPASEHDFAQDLDVGPVVTSRQDAATD